jgi:hypothetical protein
MKHLWVLTPVVPCWRYLLGIYRLSHSIFHTSFIPRLHRRYCSHSLQTVLTLTVLTIALPCRFSCTALIPVLPRTALSYSKAGCSLVNSLPFFPDSLCRSDYSHHILRLTVGVGVPPKVACGEPSRSHQSQPFRNALL